ncbi:MAG: GNAT family N-acetyltransferase [Bacteroidales bacterium]|nr:GNAT family N-acetyltransferase [Bacteroidales bacterium]MCF8327458.1 GNAT family N-acetyltransferase [Bacteroidales bacterium]
MKIRDYQKGDYEGLIEVWETTGVGSKKRGDNEQIIEQSIVMGGKMLIMEQDNTIIGTSWMTFDGRRLHLHHIAVLPEYQNLGYGKLLTKKSILFAKEKGYQIKLEVHKKNTKAIKLYEQLGFEYLGDYDIYIIRNLNA